MTACIVFLFDNAPLRRWCHAANIANFGDGSLYSKTRRLIIIAVHCVESVQVHKVNLSSSPLASESMSHVDGVWCLAYWTSVI